MIKKTVAGLTALALAFGLTACGGGENGDGAKTDDSSNGSNAEKTDDSGEG